MVEQLVRWLRSRSKIMNSLVNVVAAMLVFYFTRAPAQLRGW